MAGDHSIAKGKNDGDEAIICYCSDLSRGEIKNAVKNGCRTIFDVRKYTDKMITGQCAEKNPSGMCCGKEFMREIKKAMKPRIQAMTTTASKKIILARKLKVDKNFIPYEADDGDEFYPNGIFEFNITQMIKYIAEHLDEVALETVEVKDIAWYSDIEDAKLEEIIIGIPVILAEIAPGKYNLIDGNHRMAKARKLGLKTIQAYRLKPEQHIRFLSNQKSYGIYIEYWNDKL